MERREQSEAGLPIHARPIFETLSSGELVACLVVSAIVFVAVEAEKWLVRRRGLHGEAS